VTGILLFEVGPRGGGTWATLDTLDPATPEGSITDITGDGRRDVILFRCEGSRSVISRSVAGIDYRDDGGKKRVVVPLGGVDVLAELSDGQSYERDITSDAGLGYRARWTHQRLAVSRN
jgi:hypothetical protein